MYSILVVEDKPEISELMVDILNLDGYVVDLAADGREAVGKLKRTPVDMVITDLDMHVNDGNTLINHLKNFYPRIPIIVFSGANILYYGASSLRADKVVAKPFLPSDLRKIVETLLKKS